MSSFKVLLMPLGLRTHAAERMQGAIAVAQHFQAHLQVLFTYVSPREMIPDDIFGMSQTSMDNLTRIADEQAAESARERRELFLKICQQQGINVSKQPVAQTASASWSETSGLRSQRVARRGRLADLIVVAQPPQPELPSAMIQAALTETGRPLLLMPRTQTTFSAEHIVIGWNGSVAISRTLDAVLPCLQNARTVTVLTTAEHRNESGGLDDLLTYLSWQGVSASAQIIAVDNRSIGEALLAEAKTLDADLLVIGGYSHKQRVLDKFIGSTTQYIIANSHIPAMMAH